MALDQSYWTGLATDYQTAYQQTFGQPGTENAIVIAMSCAEHETNNGRAWPGENNFGAVQLRGLNAQELAAYHAGTLKKGDYDAAHDGCLHVDTHPTPSGPVPYPVWFVAFPTRVQGIAYFLKTLWRLTAGGTPDVPGATCADVAKSMYLHGYYEGAHGGARPVSQRKDPLTAPEQANVNDYAGAMQRCRAMIEPFISGMSGWTSPPPAPGQEAGEAGADETASEDPLPANPIQTDTKSA